MRATDRPGPALAGPGDATGPATEVQVAVIGAGLAGCLLARYLARRGMAVTVFERRPDPRRSAGEQGRSINLAISERGLDALARVGLDTTVMADALPMRGRLIHPPPAPAADRHQAGPLDFQPYSAGGDRAINSISRGGLNNALLDAAEAAGVDIVFDHRLSAVDPAAGALTLATPDGDIDVRAGVVLGADGAGSAVRAQLVEQGLVDERVDFLDHGYKELYIPPAAGEFALDPSALHIWPRGASMAIALPNPDRSFTVTLFWPNSGAQSFAELTTDEEVQRHFAAEYPDLEAITPDLVADYRANPVGVLGTVHAWPWRACGRVGLLGDAAHAIVPFYGQGANCAFEDVVVLDRCLDDTADNWPRALVLFEQRRRADTDAIAGMALDNFVEMRDKVASPVYRTTKRIEHALERLLPGVWVSRYELVSFSTVPYTDVRRRVRRQYLALGALTAAAAIGVIRATVGLVSWGSSDR